MKTITLVVRLALITLLLVIVALAGLIFTYWQLSHVRAKYGRFLHGAEAKQIGHLLHQYADQVDQLDKKVDTLAGFTAKIHQTTSLSLTRAGFIRFNPFDDTGGDQSFCLALLNRQGSGFVLSSIHARTGTRMYAKEIVDGKSVHHLSDEENSALQQALKQKLPLDKA